VTAADHLATYDTPAAALAHLYAEHANQALAFGITLAGVVDPVAAHRFLTDERTFPTEAPA
jgi:hypothetical protein